MAKNIISAVIHVVRQRPIYDVDFVPLTKQESIGERRDRRQRKCAGRKREIS